MINCRKAKKLLALYSGDDLLERQRALLQSHLERCPGCMSELEELKRSRKAVKKIAQNDLPDELPLDFPQQISQSIISDHKRFLSNPQKFVAAFRLKPFLIIAGISLCFFITLGLLREILIPGRISPDQLFEEILRTPQSLNSKLEWDPQKAMVKAFEGPFSLETWDSPKQAGVYTVMHRIGQENRPNTYVVDYCGHSRNLSLVWGYPWIKQRKKRLIARTGSPQNLYIAVFILPNSTRHERQRIKKAMVKAFNPYFNKGA